MNLASALLIFLLTVSASADVFKKAPLEPNSDFYVEVLPLHLQFRYEDTTQQTRATRTYQGILNFALQYNQYRATYAQALHSDISTSGNVSVEQNISEQLISLGYGFFKVSSVPRAVSLNLEFFGNGYIGSTETSVDTKLFGNTTKSKGTPEMVFGLGASAVGRAFVKNFFAVSEIDLKLLYSNNMNPQTVPALGFRLGLGYRF
ncbi:MAG: hypothetical protein H7061_00005 [Bdellovibrionaceae bacterium]|nr:hypothetical protein [Bdellovibrio sp.]